MKSIKTTKWVVGLLFIFILILVYKTYNPLDSVFFPKVPIQGSYWV